MEHLIETTRDFVGPWWLAVALLELQSHEVLEPVLRDVPSQLAAAGTVVPSTPVELGPMRRTGTEAHLALRWFPGRAGAYPMTGELRIVEVDANRTELTLTGAFAARSGDPHALDEVAERLAGRIETALAREIGTQ